MRKSLTTLALLVAAGPLAAAEKPADVGAHLYQKNCLRCHDASVYTRPDRRITGREALATQVRRCEQMLGLSWFDDEVEAVAGYLNEEFYKFD